MSHTFDIHPLSAIHRPAVDEAVNSSISFDASDRMEFQEARLGLVTPRPLQKNIGPMLWFPGFSEIRDTSSF